MSSEEPTAGAGKPVAGKPVAGTPVAGKCASCGARFAAPSWADGIQCPVCRSGDVRPLPVPGGAVGYAVADRSQGTASADVTFGLWAKWCGLITGNQYNSAIHRQNSELQEGGSGRPVHEVMVSLGYMDQEKAEGILRFMAIRRPNRHDEDFAQRLLQRPGVDGRRVVAVQRQQQAMGADGNEVPPLPQLLVQAHVVSEAEALEILREQQTQKVGALHVALSVSVPPPRETMLDKLRTRAAESSLTWRSLAVAGGAVLAALLAWWWAAGAMSGHGEEAYALCRTCEAIVRVPYTAYDWPAVCPRCGSRSAFYAVICPKGHVFTRLSPLGREPCPECGADRGRPVTEDDVDRIQQQRARPIAGQEAARRQPDREREPDRRIPVYPKPRR